MCDGLTYKSFNKTGSKVYWDAIRTISDSKGTVDLAVLQNALLDDSFEGILWTYKTVNLNERS
jgi:hypothetical protein